MPLPREVPAKIEDRLIVALDVPSIGEARALIDKLDGLVSFFKVIRRRFDGLGAAAKERLEGVSGIV